MKNFYYYLVLILCFAVTPLFAQETAPAPPAHPAPAPADGTQAKGPIDIEQLSKMSPEEVMALGPHNKAFMEALVKWYHFLADMRALKIEIQTAKPERQAEIQRIYSERITQGNKQANELTNLALAAFDESPNKNMEVINLLFGMIEWDCNRENYERAVEIFRHVEPFGIPETSKMLYVLAGLAALKTMNFDLAEKWLDVANATQGPKGGGTLLQTYMARDREKAQTDAGLIQQFGLLKSNWEKEQAIRQAEDATTDPEKMLPQVLIQTDKGDIVIELYENEAPNTVANFIFLVNKGFYTNTIFHRVLPNFMAQGGDPTGTGTGGPGYAIDCECYKPDARKHFRGVLSMANAGPNTNGSQFFLSFVPTYFLDGRHTVFGRVVEGFEVLSEIQKIDPEKQNQFYAPTRILGAKVLRSRPHEYKPVTNRKGK